VAVIHKLAYNLKRKKKGKKNMKVVGKKTSFLFVKLYQFCNKLKKKEKKIIFVSLSVPHEPYEMTILLFYYLS
jgi:hypothetical protein